MRTLYRIDDFQETYFVLESFGELFAALQQDLRPIYDRVKALPDHAPDDVLCRDCVFTGAAPARGRSASRRAERRYGFFALIISAGMSNVIAPFAPTNGFSACSDSRSRRANWSSSSTPPRVHTQARSVETSASMDANRTCSLRCRISASANSSRVADRAQPFRIAEDEGARNASATDVAEQPLQQIGEGGIAGRALDSVAHRDRQPSVPAAAPASSRSMRATRSSKNMRPNWLTTASKLASGNGIASACPSRHVDRQRLCRRATDSMSGFGSRPMTRALRADALERCARQSPVPQATSSTAVARSDPRRRRHMTGPQWANSAGTNISS